MTSNILDCRNLFPIRIISYDIGALCLKLLIDNNIFSFYSFTDECFNVSLINNINYIEIKNIKNETIINEINKYQNESKEIVEQALAINDVLLMGDYGLVSVNVYNARFYDKYLISTFFLAYEDNETHVMNGNFVIEIENDRIKKVYKF